MLDLSVEQVTISTGEVSYDLHNQGTQRAKGVYTEVWFSQDHVLDRADRLLKSHKNNLEAGEVKEIDLALDFPNSMGNILIRTDSRNRYSETNESNNLSITPTVTGVDLTVFDNVTNFFPSGVDTFYWVKNNGSTVSSDTTVTFSFDGRVYSTLPVRPLRPGEMHGFGNLFRFARLLTGSHQVTITVDPMNAISESNETNNSFTVSRSIQ